MLPPPPQEPLRLTYGSNDPAANTWAYIGDLSHRLAIIQYVGSTLDLSLLPYVTNVAMEEYLRRFYAGERWPPRSKGATRALGTLFEGNWHMDLNFRCHYLRRLYSGALDPPAMFPPVGA
jgi:hypothetical protein